ncbi:hypothetical protein SAMN05444285_10210 [Draconibacterium orientale]|uniref:Uncharacterized protein n=1 Tax=Draconibacterium orientale TaxID=1168034 RepID=X5DMP0_9BACT|nr:hypothetical protein [Draconibacterium orientale]AHW61847.1 hypothetical protein FH5T_09430 [Draconibacterium orientale]SES76238.1 hypothetical protein SAMN05444285_10210 [Draconibacterium orientale]
MSKLLLIIIGLIAAPFVYGQNFNVTVSGYVDFGDGLTLVGEAGSDFSTVLESQSDLGLTVAYSSGSVLAYLFNPDRPWKLTVGMTGSSDWDSDVLQLEMKRNVSSGSLIYGWFARPKYIAGFENYETLTAGINSEIYGRHGIQDIQFNFRIKGASVVLGAKDFETDVVFTVYDN